MAHIPLLCSGRYDVRGVLGEGAQGTTYDAIETRNGKPVAIKRFEVRGARAWKEVEMAEREARVLATLDHPLVPRYIEHFEEDGALYLVMEKVEGETVEAILRRDGALPESEVRRFLACADRALTYLHGRASAIIHRDIKPRNVVRRPDGTYVLVDFGAVSELLLRSGHASTVVGTIGFMAPEQLQGRALPATDVYAVGATALAALTGVEPEALPHQGLRIDVRRALTQRASLTMVMSLEQMLEPDPDRRPASLSLVLDAVRSEPPPAMYRQTQRRPVIKTGVDAMAKSLSNLLWTLWGISWAIVPFVLGHTLEIMFGSLPAILILTWHKGVLLRPLLRGVLGHQQAILTPPAQSGSRHRIDVGPGQQVRVHATDLRHDELLGRTEVAEAESSVARPMARIAGN